MTEWKLAPWEPTKEMIEAGKTTPLIDTGDDVYDQAEDYKRVYQSMWSVIPQPVIKPYCWKVVGRADVEFDEKKAAKLAEYASASKEYFPLYRHPVPDQGAEIASRDAEIARLKAENNSLHEEIKCAYATANRDMERMHKAIEESETLRDQVVLLTENVRVLRDALTEYMEAYNEHWERGMPILEPMGDAALAAVQGEQV